MAEAILKRVARGDRDAARECIQLYGGLVWSCARRFYGRSAEAEDAVQEIFIAIWQNADRFDERTASEATFVVMIARRRLIDRRRRDRCRLDAAPIREAQPMADLSLGPEHAAALSDEVTRARCALKQLRPEQREMVELAVLHGWSHRQISEKLRVPLGTVKTHVRRGLVRVRELLAEPAASITV